MKPLPLGQPVLWIVEGHPHVFEARASRAEFEHRLGPPHVVNEVGMGQGPEERWGWSCDCGLELLVTYLPKAPGGGCFSVTTEHPEVEHALAHLGWKAEVVTWRADASAPRRTDGWAVARQDDTGNRYDICVVSIRAHAECYAWLLEERAHKQSYFVEPRGTPPVLARPREGWAVIRQDDHGNRDEVAVLPSQARARRLADTFESQPRHKQTYFVEPVSPRS